MAPLLSQAQSGRYKKKKKTWNATPPIRQQSVRGFWLACMCVSKQYMHPGVRKESRTSLWNLSLSRRKVQNLHYLGVNSLISSKQGTEVDGGSYVAKLFLFWPHLSTHSLAFCNQNIHKHRRGGWWLFPFPGQRPVLSDTAPSSITPHSFSCSGFLLFLLFLLIEFFLPPGEEGPSALETLCVGLAVGSLRCSGCFDDYRGHLDQLQGCFTVLQGLAQVQDLGRKKSMLKQNLLHVKLLK